jgi:hypothetical protein
MICGQRFSDFVWSWNQYIGVITLTNAELQQWSMKARRRCVNTASMEALWSLISDVEAVVEGKSTVRDRAAIERMVEADMDRGKQ